MSTCPICRRRPAEEAYKPFCSKRCADVDLQRWFAGGYSIPDSVDEASTSDPFED
ncbi:MAG TPA: DNA gyrase inhibitor YacG [Brevundimonas sp.]|nr:DNA gyrase inhibitor YacG [Brevundimonas sp.]